MAVTAAIGVGSLALGVARYFSANSAAKRDRARADSLKRPFYKVQDEYYQNKNIAAEMATYGLPIDVTNQLARERSQGLASSLDTLKKTAGGPNAVAALNKSFSDSLLNQSSINAQQQMKNIEYFMNVNKDIAGQKSTQWGVNELDPYNSNLKQINEKRAADEQNKNNALNETIQAASSFATSSSNSGLMGKLFGGDDPNGLGTADPNSSNPGSVALGGGGGSIDVASNAPALNSLNLDIN
jgi:hypothetical protein